MNVSLTTGQAEAFNRLIGAGTKTHRPLSVSGVARSQNVEAMDRQS